MELKSCGIEWFRFQLRVVLVPIIMRKNRMKDESMNNVNSNANQFLSVKLLLKLSLSIFLLLGVLLAFYFYLDNLYLVDEILSFDKLRELNLNEKFTIRIVGTENLKDLNSFILKYSLCPVVHEIQVIWTKKEAHPLNSYFKFAHTHSKVTFITNSASSNNIGIIETESISFLLL
jgi:hypothetical protein